MRSLRIRRSPTSSSSTRWSISLFAARAFFKVPVVKRQSFPTVAEKTFEIPQLQYVIYGRCPCCGRSCVVPRCRSWLRRVSHSCVVENLIENPEFRGFCRDSAENCRGCWIAWFTPAWQAQHVTRTCGATVLRSVLSRRLLVKVEGSKSRHASLGGNSLLDCVVYARVAGAACAKYVLGDSVKVTPLAALAGRGKVEESSSSSSGEVYIWSFVLFGVKQGSTAQTTPHLAGTTALSTRK